MHSLPRDQEELINNWIREWKVDFLIMRGDGTIIDTGEYIPDFSDCITIPAYDNVKKKKYHQEKYPSRAKKKRELQTMIEESELTDDNFER